MPTDPRKRQKKLERRAAKRKEKRHNLVRAHSAGLPGQLAAANRFPVRDCWIGDSLKTQGIGWVLISREMPNGQVAVATFLVDRYCLGVKDVWAEVLHRTAYEEKYLRRRSRELPAHDVSPAEARKFVESAVAYARGLGLSPHADYQKAMILFGDIDPAQSDAQFEFGKDGKPFFISGPHDTPERCRQIMAILMNKLGPGGFHYLMEVGGPGPDDDLSGPPGIGWDEDE